MHCHAFGSICGTGAKKLEVLPPASNPHTVFFNANKHHHSSTSYGSVSLRPGLSLVYIALLLSFTASRSTATYLICSSDPSIPCLAGHQPLRAHPIEPFSAPIQAGNQSKFHLRATAAFSHPRNFYLLHISQPHLTHLLSLPLFSLHDDHATTSRC